MSPQPDHSYKVSDLARCQVVTETGEVLGQLVDVYPTRANDVFVVRSSASAQASVDKPAGREYLIPALKTVVIGIDLTLNKITVRLPEGLKKIYEEL